MEQQQMDEKEKISDQWWEPLWHFCIHVMVGTGIFVIISVPAILLNLLIVWLAKMSIDPIILAGLYVAEYTLFAIDILLFLVFLIRSGWRAFGEM